MSYILLGWQFAKRYRRVTFHVELACINKGKPLRSTSRILSFTSFLDASEILCVGGRLRNSHSPMASRNTMPQRDHVTSLIVRRAFQKTLHGGAKLHWVYAGHLLDHERKTSHSDVSVLRNPSHANYGQSFRRTRRIPATPFIYNAT